MNGLNLNYLASIIFLIVLLSITLVLVLRLARIRRYLKRELIYLEIKPPAIRQDKQPSAEQFFKALHGLSIRSFKQRLLGDKPSMSLEIDSSFKTGIRYIMVIEQKYKQALIKIVQAYSPLSTVGEIPHPKNEIKYVLSAKPYGAFYLPLSPNSDPKNKDPLNFVLSSLSQLKSTEYLNYQVIIEPLNQRINNKLTKKIHRAEHLNQLSVNKTSQLLGSISKSLSFIVSIIQSLTQEILDGLLSPRYRPYNNQNNEDKRAKLNEEKPLRILSSFERDYMQAIQDKSSQALFRVNIRLLVSSDNPNQYKQSFSSALGGFSSAPYLTLRLQKATLLPTKHWLRFKSIKRLPNNLSRSIILSAQELAEAYHLPEPKDRPDNLLSSLSRSLAPPLSLKQSPNFDLVLGENIHRGQTIPIGLSVEERKRHLYIIGGTGNGKSTMLLYSIIKDIKANKGVAVIDPHGDLAETVLGHVPKHRLNDVVYFNPDDLEFPFALNLLELPDNLSPIELLKQKDLITESVISIFRKIFSEDDSGGHRIEYILRNTIHTALTIKGANLFSVLKLLQNTKYRRQVVSKLTDQDLKDFWHNEMEKAGGMQQVKMTAGVTAKLGRFNSNAATKAILSAEKSSLDFNEILNTSKILICNFSKGYLGEDVSSLFGTTVLAKLQLASLARARQAQSTRSPYYLYVDEFQNFATPSFSQMLSESRKYGLYLTMAEQSTSQQKDQKIVEIILANVGTIVCFRTGNPSDEKMLLPLFTPFIEPGEIANLDAFNFFARLASVKAQEPLSGRTILINEPYNKQIAQKAIEISRKNYANKQEIKEKGRAESNGRIKSVLIPGG